MNNDLAGKKYLVAVSGGIDSIVLLDLMVKKYSANQLVVAHFDHGIRQDSADDALFVKELAKSYGLKFESRAEKLGPRASEELARTRRYFFLREMAKKHQAIITTAHHADDVIESIMINLKRGTGWRGLVVMGAQDVFRPLIQLTKKEIIEYAKTNNLKWREDTTNRSLKYLRNQIRRQLSDITEEQRQQLLSLWVVQTDLKQAIQQEIKKLLRQHGYEKEGFNRYFFININQAVALECLRFLTKGLLTRPQLTELLLAIKTYASGKQFLVGQRVQIFFSTRNFVIKLLK